MSLTHIWRTLMTKIILSYVISWAVTVVLMPIIKKIYSKISAKQTILHYVKEHEEKQGTITMGGVVFFLTTLTIVFFFLQYQTEWFFILAVSFGFALLGFLDDFIKIKYKQNLGLRPYQKIIGQVGIAIILAFYVYFSSQGGIIVLPFTYHTINLGVWIIPIIVFVCIATTNSVNLIDGLDGLASNVSMLFIGGIITLLIIYKNILFQSGADAYSISTLNNIIILSTIFTGSLFGYTLFNTYKASIFMGDVGALGIGGFVSALCCVVGFELFVPILGVMYVVTALSDIIQVLHYKRTKKRIFKIAPLHHHFQKSGYSEPKIVFVYSTVTIIAFLMTLLLTLI